MSKEMNDKHKERLRQAEEVYNQRITEGKAVLFVGMLIVIGVCIVLF